MEVEEERMTPEELFGAPKGAPGQWASCLQIVDPSQMGVLYTLQMENNEAAVSLCIADFSNRPDLGSVLVVGTVAGLRFYPLESEGDFWLMSPCVSKMPLWQTGACLVAHPPARLWELHC